MFASCVAVALAFCGADEEATVPNDVRDYFARAESAKKRILEIMEEDIEKLEIRIKSTASAKEKATMTARKSAIESEYRKARSMTAKPWLATPPEAGQLGHFERATVVRVIDDKSMLVEMKKARPRQSSFESVVYDSYTLVVVRGIDTSGMTKGKAIPQTELFRVTQTDVDIKPIDGMRPRHEVQRIPIGEVNKWRDQIAKESNRKQESADNKANP